MNAVEIEEAITELADQSFDPDEFPYAFLQAFGNKATTINRLRSGSTNHSDLGGVLQTNNIHIAVAPEGEATKTLTKLKDSPTTSKYKAKFILATDGQQFEAEDLVGGETVACDYPDFPNHFGFFLPLAGITTVRQIRENAFDIRATSRLNKLYVELLRDNPDWGATDRRPDMNHFMARLTFCFFAEDTEIFSANLFTGTIEQMSERDSSNTHEVIGEIFRAMNTGIAEREKAKLPRWADAFPFVNGGLFSGRLNAPRFSKIARSYLLHIGNLDWKQINPDIFGSMIQAVADDEERGELGMHYTSVPNILKVLNPLFLDDLREKLEEAGDNDRKLLNLRKRIARVRVFDPACGSGNFLVIAYKHMREIEHEVNARRGERGRKSDIPLTNFRGIEIRDFAADIARLALIIAGYQCDVRYLGQKQALKEFLPLSADNWITCGNALRLDWLSICPPTGTGVKLQADDLFGTPLEQIEVDFENEGGETYICGNPPYLGSQRQTAEGKAELKAILGARTKNWKSLDYVAGWLMKAADYGTMAECSTALVATNSICQGRQVATIWPLIFATGHAIAFAHESFKWANLASNNAGVTVVILGISNHATPPRHLYSHSPDSGAAVRAVENINGYLVPGPNITVAPLPSPINAVGEMNFGNMPNDGGHLLLSQDEADAALNQHEVEPSLIRRFVGAKELIQGTVRHCLWVPEQSYPSASENAFLSHRFDEVQQKRAASERKTTEQLADVPYRFGEVRQTGDETVIIVPRHSSETRHYLPVDFYRRGTIVGDAAFALYDVPLWNLGVIASRLHLVWIATVCGKLETRYRYSNTLGWNTFPVPTLTEKNKVDLTRTASDILLAREAQFPATIADLYDPEVMPENLREAHERNDETLERIYIGRRFKNDTERLEKLFDLYTEMTAGQSSGKERTRKEST